MEMEGAGVEILGTAVTDVDCSAEFRLLTLFMAASSLEAVLLYDVSSGSSVLSIPVQRPSSKRTALAG